MFTKNILLALFMFNIDFALAMDPVTGAQQMVLMVQQLNELEQLTTNAVKYTETAQRMSEVAEDKMYLGERFKDWGEDISTFNDSDFSDGLGGINERVSELKMSREDIEDIYRELSKDEVLLKRKVKWRESRNHNDETLLNKYKRQGLRNTKESNIVMRTISQNTGANVVETAKSNIIGKKQLTSLEKAQVHRIKQEKRRLSIEAETKKAWGELPKGAIRRSL